MLHLQYGLTSGESKPSRMTTQTHCKHMLQVWQQSRIYAIVPPLFRRCRGTGRLFRPECACGMCFAIVQLRVKHTYECIGCCALVLGCPPPRRFSQVSEVGAGSRGASQSLGRKGCMLSRPPGAVSVDVPAVPRARCDQ